eukprot:COSAG01_NODE_931_length_12617_cov_20.567163_12_plen_231_part_00
MRRKRGPSHHPWRAQGANTRVLTRDETGDVNLLASGQPERQRARGHARVQRREHQCARSVWKGVLGCTFTGWGVVFKRGRRSGPGLPPFIARYWWPYALQRTSTDTDTEQLEAACWPPPLGPPRFAACDAVGKILSMHRILTTSATPHLWLLLARCWRLFSMLFRARTHAERAELASLPGTGLSRVRDSFWPAMHCCGHLFWLLSIAPPRHSPLFPFFPLCLCAGQFDRQ